MAVRITVWPGQNQIILTGVSGYVSGDGTGQPQRPSQSGQTGHEPQNVRAG
jgi:hypothetical protein